MAKIIDGKNIANEINLNVKQEIEKLKQTVGYAPKLVSILVGGSKDAELYVSMQRKTAEIVGIEFESRQLDRTVTAEELLAEIQKLNQDKTVTAVIIQKPLPDGIDHAHMVDHILPKKDAEGIHPFNVGMISRKEASIVPSTPGAVMKILDSEEIDLYGKEVTVVGHSANIGKPLSLMLMNEMATTTVCHIATYEKGKLEEHTKNAEVLIVAVGKANLIKKDWVKDGAVVIDVGINKHEGRIVGDVDFEEVKEKASLITPVPGGVGPVTVSILMRNVLRAYRCQNVKA